MNSTEMNATEIILELTGPLERAVGQSRVCLKDFPGSCLGDVLTELVRQQPAAASVLGSVDHLQAAVGTLPAGVLVIRDSRPIAARLETPIAAGDRLTLMLMISGG